MKKIYSLLAILFLAVNVGAAPMTGSAGKAHSGAAGASYALCANDTQNKEGCDKIGDGICDNVEIQAIADLATGIKLQFLDGTYDICTPLQPQDAQSWEGVNPGAGALLKASATLSPQYDIDDISNANPAVLTTSTLNWDSGDDGDLGNDKDGASPQSIFIDGVRGTPLQISGNYNTDDTTFTATTAVSGGAWDLRFTQAGDWVKASGGKWGVLNAGGALGTFCTGPCTLNITVWRDDINGADVSPATPNANEDLNVWRKTGMANQAGYLARNRVHGRYCFDYTSDTTIELYLWDEDDNVCSATALNTSTVSDAAWNAWRHAKENDVEVDTAFFGKHTFMIDLFTNDVNGFEMINLGLNGNKTVTGSISAMSTMIVNASPGDGYLENLWVTAFRGDGIILGNCWGWYSKNVMAEYNSGRGFVGGIAGQSAGTMGTDLKLYGAKLISNGSHGLEVGCPFAIVANSILGACTNSDYGCEWDSVGTKIQTTNVNFNNNISQYDSTNNSMHYALWTNGGDNLISNNTLLGKQYAVWSTASSGNIYSDNNLIEGSDPCGVDSAIILFGSFPYSDGTSEPTGPRPTFFENYGNYGYTHYYDKTETSATIVPGRLNRACTGKAGTPKENTDYKSIQTWANPLRFDITGETQDRIFDMSDGAYEDGAYAGDELILKRNDNTAFTALIALNMGGNAIDSYIYLRYINDSVALKWVDDTQKWALAADFRDASIPVTVGNGAFTVDGGLVPMLLTAGGAVTVTTIDGGWSGQVKSFIFGDNNITFTDSADCDAGETMLSAAHNPTEFDILTLRHNGTCWRETSFQAL